jgi:hypothetical protein
MFRIAFDPALPVFATSAFPDGTVASGEQFDWRAKGIAEIDALALFRSGLLTHQTPLEAPLPVVPPTKPHGRAQRR